MSVCLKEKFEYSFSEVEMRHLLRQYTEIPLEEIVQIARIENEMELNQCLFQKKSPFITRVFSHLRDNAISWLPFEKGDNVLIIGSGFGIFTKFLSSVGCNIYCMENDKLSVYINYWRNIENSNVMIFFEADMESVVEDKD